MRGLGKLTLLVVACLLFAMAAYSPGQSESVGIFEGHGDVGTVCCTRVWSTTMRPGRRTPSAAAAKTCGSRPMRFQFVWKKDFGRCNADGRHFSF